MMIKQINKNTCSGFTIIEVLVSSVLLTFLMITVVIFLRRGRNIEAHDFQRRTARHIIENQFEIEYNHHNYKTVTTKNKDTIINNIEYTLTNGIEPHYVQANNNIEINGLLITAQVIWQTPSGFDDTLELKKCIADIQ